MEDTSESVAPLMSGVYLGIGDDGAPLVRAQVELVHRDDGIVSVPVTSVSIDTRISGECK